VLKPDTIYAAGDRFVCIDCAGYSAKHTGYDLHGRRLVQLTVIDVVSFKQGMAEYGHPHEPVTCEGKHLEARVEITTAGRPALAVWTLTGSRQ
jgi:hypothetical protein